MKHGAAVITQLAKCLWGLGVLAAGAAAWGQTPPPAVPPYQDRVIAGGSLTPDLSTEDGATNDAGGLARSWQIDGVMSALSSRSGSSTHDLQENGIVAKSQWDTVDYGACSLDASARTGGSGDNLTEQGQGGTFTLRQRAMPFDDGWQADNALGDLNAPNINLARSQPRFFLPTTTMQGISTEWRGPSGVQVVAGGGVPGLYDGIVVPNFHTLSGSTATAGAQWSPTAGWTLGGQVIDAHSANLAIGSAFDTAALQTSTTGLVTAAWQGVDEKLQLNLLDGSVAGKGNGTGVWLDGSVNQGRFSQSGGLFRIDPNLTWGNQLISNDVEGAYYRFNYHTRQWMSDIGIDEVHSVSGLNPNISFLTADTRYQLSRDWGVGGVSNVSQATGTANWSIEGFVDHPNIWGTARAQGYYARTTQQEDASFTVDQAWETPVGVRFSSSASVDRVSSSYYGNARQDSTLLGLSLVGGGQFTNQVSLEGNIHWESVVQGRAAPGVSANVSLIYQAFAEWQLLATYYDSRVGTWTPLTVLSPLNAPIAPVVPSMQDRGIFLTLRYKHAAGQHFAPLGGAAGAGSGRVTGTVYLDATDNGHYDAGEAGAPNVTVVLDGRFSVQTDAAGRFDFPTVAAGHHVISVVADNLPLPWSMVGDGRAELVVTTRDRTDVNLGARRIR